MAVSLRRKRCNPNNADNNHPKSSKPKPSDHHRRKRSKKKSSEEIIITAASKFMSTVSDDLLLEILVRVSDLRHALTVSKRWSGLIRGLAETLVRRHHLKELPYGQYSSSDPSYSPPYTLLLRFGTERNCGDVLSGKSKILHHILRNPHAETSAAGGNYLGFMPNWRNLVIRSSFDDLLLLSSGQRQYYVANPVTREWTPLPECPPLIRHQRGAIRCILMCLHDGESYDLTFRNAGYKFRVLVLTYSGGGVVGASSVTVFCSETGQWIGERDLRVFFAIMNADFAATREGVLHWPAWGRKGFYALDVFKASGDPGRLRFIHLFPGFRRCHQLPRDFRIKLRLGVVNGKLRAAELALKKKKKYVLRVWELSSDNDNNGAKQYCWTMIHRVRFNKKKKTKRVMVIAFHPDNGNVVFVLRDLKIFRCEFKERRFHKIGMLSSEDFPKGIIGTFPVFFRAFSLMHPQTWPTQVPQLPSIS